eukprot:scaffold13465_cov130-Amphora_coffeaeformis.AAC.2
MARSASRVGPKLAPEYLKVKLRRLTLMDGMEAESSGSMLARIPVVPLGGILMANLFCLVRSVRRRLTSSIKSSGVKPSSAVILLCKRILASVCSLR